MSVSVLIFRIEILPEQERDNFIISMSQNYREVSSTSLCCTTTSLVASIILEGSQGAKILREGSLPPNLSCVTCQLSCFTCHMSHVKCHKKNNNISSFSYIYIYFFFYSDKVVKLVGIGSVIKGATPPSFSFFVCFCFNI